MRFHACHGVLPQERIVGNDYEVSVAMDYDTTAAALSDDVADTLSYADAYEVVRQVMSQPCQLLERVAWLVGEALFRQFEGLRAVEVRIMKVNPPIGADCEGAEVTIRVTR